MREKKWKRKIALLVASVLLITALCGCDTSSQKDGEKSEVKLPRQVISLAEAPVISGSPVALARQDNKPLTDFSQELLRIAWAEERAQNSVLSPVSVYLAMMVTACSNEQGDKGQIAEWEALFGVPETQWNAWGTKLMRHLNWSKEESCITTANSLWLDTDMTLPEDVMQRIAQYLYTDVYQGDLQSNDIVKGINNWVDYSTRGMIPEFRKDPYNDMTVLSILNAVYLEAKWQQPFLATRTEEKIFYMADGEEMLSEFMQDFLCRRAYVKADEWDGVVLPYRDGNLAFVALRPTAGQSVDELLMSLEADVWGTCCVNAADTLMNFSMPKFTVEYQQLLTETLAQMGLGDVLQESGIGVGQTVKIQVDEEGTKAAAVTEVTAAGAIEVTQEPLEIHLDHSFIYAVVDTVTQIPLFVGVMDRPVQQ